MKRTMSEQSFAEWQQLAREYGMPYEVLDRRNGWVCVYIGY